MRHVIGTLLVALALTVLSYTASQQPVRHVPTVTEKIAPVATHCYLHTRVDRATRHSHGGSHTWWVRGGIQFLTCRRAGHRNYDIITGAFIAYNRDGSGMNCHWWNPIGALDYMRGNPYMRDAYGNRVNPREFHAPCDTRSYHKTWRHYRSDTKLFWLNGHPPRGVIWYKLIFRRAANGGRSAEPFGNFSMPLKGITS